MPSGKHVTTLELLEAKRAGRKIVVLTAYDALFAQLLDESGVDVVLVGDSVNTVLAGQDSTLSATLEQMIYHTRMVRAGVRRALVIIDLPFLTYQVSIEEAKRNAGRAMQLTGANGVKLEGGLAIRETVRALVDIGIPVMGHVGGAPRGGNSPTRYATAATRTRRTASSSDRDRRPAPDARVVPGPARRGPARGLGAHHGGPARGAPAIDRPRAPGIRRRAGQSV